MAIVTPHQAPSAPQPTQQAQAPERQEPINEAPAPEAAPQEAKSAAPKEELLSPKFADLARKEKALRARANELKAREEAYKAREADFQSASSFKERLSKDPISVLNELGVTYDQIVNGHLNQPKPEEIMIQKMQAEIDALKAARENDNKQNVEQQTAQYKQAVNQIRNDVKMLIQGNEEFSTIQDTGSQEAVVALIEETFNKTGSLLTNEEAALQVENYLIEEAYKMAQLKKVQKRLAPKPSAPKQEPPKPQQQMKTLTNAVAQTASKPRSAKERYERAILAARGELKD